MENIAKSGLLPDTFFQLMLLALSPKGHELHFSRYASPTALEIVRRQHSNMQHRGSGVVMPSQEDTHRVVTARNALLTYAAQVGSVEQAYLTYMQTFDPLYLALDFANIDPSNPALPLTPTQRQDIQRIRVSWTFEPSKMHELLIALKEHHA